MKRATEIADEELYQLTVDMRRTEPGDVLEYVERWLKFQERFSEVLPMIPIYSNIYFDFYTQQLQYYNISSELTWSRAIVPAIYAALPEPETEEGETFDEFEEFGDEFIEFEE